MATSLNAPYELSLEMKRLLDFKTATLTNIGMRRSGVWCAETSEQRIEHLSLLFGALAADPKSSIRGLGIPRENLSFGLLVFPSIWDWYVNWRAARRGSFTTWEVDMLQFGKALCQPTTGWLRQLPELSQRVRSVDTLISPVQIEEVQADWSGACDRLCDYAGLRAREIARVARVHRDPFEPIPPVLEAESPVGQYRLITEEIERRLPDAQQHPIAAAEAVRSFLMLRLGLHLGIRQRNLRELMLHDSLSTHRSDRELDKARRGELRWIQQKGQWEVFIPSSAFKNASSTFFSDQPFRLALPDLGNLYAHLDAYVTTHRRTLLKDHADPGVFFVKSVKSTTRNLAYDGCSFYEAWRLAIQRYGIWNPYTKRGAIAGLLPHGPHSVRDVLATHILKKTGSFEQASYAIQDTPATVAKHYGRFLPQDKAMLAAEILNEAWL